MKSAYFTVILAGGVFLASTSGFAKVIDKYGVSVQVSNAGGPYSEFLLAGMGTTCNSNLNVSESEMLLDSSGQYKERTFKSGGDFSMTLFGQPQASMSLPVNPENKDPHLTVEVQETCVHNYTERRTCTDNQGRKYSCDQPESDIIPLNWSCQVPASQFPAQKGAGMTVQCNPPNNQAYMMAFGGDQLHQAILNLAHQKTFTINVQNQGQDFHYENYNCPSNIDLAHLDPNLDKIIRVAGGVQTGGLAKSDIDYSYSINGGSVKDKIRKDGSTNFDILYCEKSPGEPIDLKLAAKHGSNGSPAQEAVFNGTGDPRKTLQFEMPGSLWGKVKSQVQVQLAQ